MKVVVTNQVALNVGDAAILRGILAVLRAAFGDSVELVVLDAYGEAPGRYYPDLKFRQSYQPFGGSFLARLVRRLDFAEVVPRILGWLAANQQGARFLPRGLAANLEEFRSANLVISTGGTYLVEHYKLGAKLLQLSAAVASGTPTVMFTQSLGPFRRARNRKWLREIVPAVRLVLLRDQRSFENLSSGGISTAHARIMADAAFALADVAPLSSAHARASNGPLRVAVSVREWMFPTKRTAPDRSSKYRETVAAMVEYLVRTENAEVTFISTCQGAPEYRYDDSAVASEIAETLPEDVRSKVMVDNEFHAPERLKEILGKFDLVIATRMHMAILSMCAGTPVLPIAYEFKTKELFDGLELGEWVLDIDTLEPGRSVRTLSEFIVSLDRIRDMMAPHILRRRREALSVATELQEIL